MTPALPALATGAAVGLQEGVAATRIEVDGWSLAAFLGYLAVLVAIGAYSTRFSSEGISEFFVGGRKMKRLVVALLVGASLVMGLLAEDLVFWLVLFAWAGLGAALGPTAILALYWKRTTRAGIFAGLVTGTVTTIVWYLSPALKASVYELIPAFLLSLAATVIVSRRTRPPEEVEEHFGAMMKHGSK